ncbi:hypothetical protein SGQ44_13790 [Flavobacterium sp. Fl-77]|uniref:Lipoprotein n=1 Tax=Flavobacterium flavipigmentatum TaxID=2893884 RepID=A0AAJ2W210_9FLAO|nr:MULTISPECIES: hypothetical protein [unclassified Flavobacterium]MDX6183096.1 hypothetical protein [Flavobacterium sp. Fl-33]MDX6186835.1 hypothetical protein [Flavobacterium sp. Fl-77]UFH40488.1 hypothetical protein LNP22_09470 [Flavobacterium sp. F-70]
MKFIPSFIILMLLTSCQITETININPDGTGKIEITELRDENSYMQLAGENYSKEEEFKDTTFVFKEYMIKYKENFSKYLPAEQELFQKYADTKVHIKKSSFEKEFRKTVTLKFNKVTDIPDLYKTENYADDIKFNYALTAEKEYWKVAYDFDGLVFKRTVLITSQELLQKSKDEFNDMDPKYKSLKLVQKYVLNYHFPRKIKVVSNHKAVISMDKKSLQLEFQLSECMQNPESTNLEVVLE